MFFVILDQDTEIKTGSQSSPIIFTSAGSLLNSHQ